MTGQAVKLSRGRDGPSGVGWACVCPFPDPSLGPPGKGSRSEGRPVLSRPDPLPGPEPSLTHAPSRGVSWTLRLHRLCLSGRSLPAIGVSGHLQPGPRRALARRSRRSCWPAGWDAAPGPLSSAAVRAGTSALCARGCQALPQRCTRRLGPCPRSSVLFRWRLLFKCDFPALLSPPPWPLYVPALQQSRAPASATASVVHLGRPRALPCPQAAPAGPASCGEPAGPSAGCPGAWKGCVVSRGSRPGICALPRPELAFPHLWSQPGLWGVLESLPHVHVFRSLSQSRACGGAAGLRC